MSDNKPSQQANDNNTLTKILPPHLIKEFFKFLGSEGAQELGQTSAYFHKRAFDTNLENIFFSEKSKACSSDYRKF